MPLIPISRTKTVEASVIRYFDEAPEEELQRLNDTCLKLHNKCVNDELVDTGILPDTVPHVGHGDYSAHLNNGLFDVLEVNMVCDPRLHGSSTDETEGKMLQHQARLCLFENQDATAGPASDAGLDILVSSAQLKFWQEFHLRMYVPEISFVLCEPRLTSGKATRVFQVPRSYTRAQICDFVGCWRSSSTLVLSSSFNQNVVCIMRKILGSWIISLYRHRRFLYRVYFATTDWLRETKCHWHTSWHDLTGSSTTRK